MPSGKSAATRPDVDGEVDIPGLPPDTSRVFQILANVAELSRFVLVGGTAMALQCRHRLSEDLDFWLPEGRLREREIRPAIDALRQHGYEVIFTYPSAGEISPFKIQRGLFEGISLEERMREYSANGVKIQFFAPADHERDVFGPFAATAERALVVLRGDLPLDESDEGFQSLAPEITLAQIHADFRDWTDRYEQDLVRSMAAATHQPG